MSKTGYHYKDCGNDTYQTLHRPDGSEVLTITEPEDRTFGRDLSGVIAELNKLHDEAARYSEALTKIARGEFFGCDCAPAMDIASVALGDAGAGGAGERAE